MQKDYEESRRFTDYGGEITCNNQLDFFNIFWDVTRWEKAGKKSCCIGLVGIGISILVYGSLCYFGFIQRGGICDELRFEKAKKQLTQLVPTIEFYRLQHGHFPADLEMLKKNLPANAEITINDSTKQSAADREKMPLFYYSRTPTGKNYILLGTGPDNIPFSNDDILPEISTNNTGLLINPAGQAN